MKVEHDQSTMDFPRDIKGGYEDCDVFIKCKNNCKIFHYGRKTLEFYCPSLQRGNNIIRQIYN